MVRSNYSMPRDQTLIIPCLRTIQWSLGIVPTVGLVSQWLDQTISGIRTNSGSFSTRTTVLEQGIFVENMEFECDVLLWYVLTEYGLTCEIVCEISGSKLENRGCVLLFV